MIPLVRQRATPPVNSRFTGPKLVKNSLKLLRDQRSIKKGDLDKHPFDSGIWKHAKEQLLADTFDKCAYCETPTAVVTFGDVEHYRPKSVYWWLAYCLDNYLASCAICNQKFKKDKFTRQNSKLRAPTVRSNSIDSTLEALANQLVPDPLDLNAVADFDALHLSERPFPINPYIDDPTALFAWRADENLKEVELIAKPGNGEAEDYVNAAKEIYGLDRSQLRKARYVVFANYKVFREVLLEGSLSTDLTTLVESQVQTMSNNDQPYAGMIRFFDAEGTPTDWEQNEFLIPAPTN